MIKFIKKLSYLVCGLFIYAFIGGLTYSVHEHFYPGSDVKWSNPKKPDGNASVGVGVVWPVSLPIWGGVEAITFVFTDIIIPIAGIGASAGEDLLNE